MRITARHPRQTHGPRREVRYKRTVRRIRHIWKQISKSQQFKQFYGYWCFSYIAYTAVFLVITFEVLTIKRSVLQFTLTFLSVELRDKDRTSFKASRLLVFLYFLYLKKFRRVWRRYYKIVHYYQTVDIYAFATIVNRRTYTKININIQNIHIFQHFRG